MTIKINSGGSVTRVTIGSENANLSDEDGFGDAEALRRAFRDERYQSSASYRQRVQDAIAASEAVTDSAPNAGLGRFQVTHMVQKSADEIAHEQRMIAVATKAGL